MLHHRSSQHKTQPQTTPSQNKSIFRRLAVHSVYDRNSASSQKIDNQNVKESTFNDNLNSALNHVENLPDIGRQNSSTSSFPSIAIQPMWKNVAKAGYGNNLGSTSKLPLKTKTSVMSSKVQGANIDDVVGSIDQWVPESERGSKVADRKINLSQRFSQIPLLEMTESAQQRTEHHRQDRKNRSQEKCTWQPVQRMEEGNQGESVHDDEDIHPKINAKAAVVALIEWMKKQDAFASASNYCVAALANDDLIITKVNGVTTQAAAIEMLGQKIQKEGIEFGRDIYLAQKYSTAVGSNHAEMCILAAADKLGQKVNLMGCTGPNCPYCDQMMKDDGIPSLNAGQDGKAQQGWAHPRASIFWGSQVSDSPCWVQVADLANFNAGKGARIGLKTIKKSEGQFSWWL
jgi:hypothetical protein